MNHAPEEQLEPVEKLARSIDTIAVMFRGMLSRMIPLQLAVAIMQLLLCAAFLYELVELRDQREQVTAIASHVEELGRNQAETKQAAKKAAEELQERTQVEVRSVRTDPESSAAAVVVIKPPATSSAPTIEVPLRLEDAKTTVSSSAAGGGGR